MVIIINKMVMSVFGLLDFVQLTVKVLMMLGKTNLAFNFLLDIRNGLAFRTLGWCRFRLTSILVSQSPCALALLYLLGIYGVGIN